ncbi:hypothetical protein PMG11_01651 [Penicillium brasilianum]|uniref:Uncharacterized protein n=1 Tax=Penicillium brasilianum TaxID=104259 RepID=A0A0F7TEX2_PENBI|nr:hypothetical protein PMG11_01651 [Penicillium brasilianum]
MMSTFLETNKPAQELTLEKALGIASMVVARSTSDQRKFENNSQYPAKTTAMSGQDPFDNELFVPLGSPLPTIGAQETQKPSTPMVVSLDAPKTIKVVPKSKRQAPAKNPNLEPVKKKKAVVFKRGQAECNGLEFTETKPDAATIMDFPLPKVNHGGIRPSRVPRHLYSTPSIPDLDDVNAVERAFRDLLSVREMVDWESR